MIAGFEQPSEGDDPDRGRRRRRPAAAQAPDQHRLPELRALPPPERRATTSPSGCSARASTRARSASGSPPSCERVGLARRGQPAAVPALRRHAAAGRAGPRPGQPAEGAAARRAARRARPEAAQGLQVELKRIQREVGITFVYVTHDQEEALTMSDRIAVMNRGRVEQVGDPEESTTGRRPPSSPASSASPT